MQQQASSVVMGYRCASFAFKRLFVHVCPHPLSAPKDAVLLLIINLLQFSSVQKLHKVFFFFSRESLIIQIQTSNSQQLDNCCQLSWPEDDSKNRTKDVSALHIEANTLLSALKHNGWSE